MAAAYAAADIDAAQSRCEEEFVGFGWREQPRSIRGALRLDPELIQASVRARFDRFRRCYENGLARDSTLHGKVTVSFEIDVHGHVSDATDDGSDLPDREVIACIVKEYSLLRFPKPEGGTAKVVYPINFDPAR